MFFWRPKRSPSRLKLREKNSEDKGNSRLESESESESATATAPRVSEVPGREERQLTVMFQFNGHDFEAYEVLGLAAGSSPASVEEAYQKILVTTSPDSLEIYRIAYECIKRR